MSDCLIIGCPVWLVDVWKGEDDGSSKNNSTSDSGTDQSSDGYEPSQKEITASIVRGEVSHWRVTECSIGIGC